MALSNRQVAKADPNAQLSAEEEAQLQEMQNEPEPTEAEPQPTEELEPSEPEPSEEPEPQPEPKKRGDPNVALREEREARRKLERQLAEERKNRETIEARTNQILERFAQQQQPQPQPTTPDLPDVQTHPVEHILAQLKRYNDRVEELGRITMAQEQQRSAAAQIGTIEQRAIALEQVFRQEVPDYDDAVRHLASQRDRELQAAGYEDPGERGIIMRNEALALAQRAIHVNRNPGEMIYELAKVRGYQPPDPVEQTRTTQQASTRDRLATVERGQQQARSLGAVRGTGPVPMNADRLGKMSYEEFDKWLQTPEGMALLGS